MGELVRYHLFAILIKSNIKTSRCWEKLVEADMVQVLLLHSVVYKLVFKLRVFKLYSIWIKSNESNI